jgi:hypothetical protein
MIVLNLGLHGAQASVTERQSRNRVLNSLHTVVSIVSFAHVLQDYLQRLDAIGERPH